MNEPLCTIKGFSYKKNTHFSSVVKKIGKIMNYFNYLQISNT